jgi:hypothetical protein
MGDFYAGGWLEAKHIRNEVGLDNATTKLSQRYFGWENRSFTVHAGSFYKVFDHGLILNSFRDDEVGVDKLLDGAYVSWRNNYVDFDAMTAKDTSESPNRPIFRGVRTKIKPFSLFQLGGGYVSYIEPDNNRTNLNEINGRILTDYVDANIEYAQRKYTIYEIFEPSEYEKKEGDGTYINITGSYSKFSGLVEYKNYYDLFYNHPYMGTMNIAPAINHQDRLLITEMSNVYKAALGERGYRGNLAFAYNDYWGAEIDYSQSKSRTPSYGENTETYTEIRGNFLGEHLFKFGIDFFNFSWQDSFIADWGDSSEAVGTFKRNELKPELELQILIDDFRSVELDGYMINYDYIFPSFPAAPDTLSKSHYMADSSDYSEKFLSISFVQAPNFRLTIGGSLSSRKFSPDHNKMAFAELSYIFGNHELTIFQGDERGGLVCSGGICTFHPTFRGTRVTLTSRL